MLPQQWLTTHETRQREVYGTEGGEKQNERQSAKPIKFSTSARRKRKKKSEGDRAQQEDREMSWGVLPLKLNYSEVTVDEPTIQKRGKGEGTEKKEPSFSSQQLYTKPQECLLGISLPLPCLSCLHPSLFLSISLQWIIHETCVYTAHSWTPPMPHGAQTTMYLPRSPSH